MSIEFELFDQAKKRARRRGFLLGILVVIVLLTTFTYASTFWEPKRSSPHIARIKISGPIFDDFALNKLFEKMVENENVRGVILHINSPGGSVVGAESTYVSLSKLSREKPLVSVLGETAASGGYLIALAADFIIARGNTLTGSVGVIVQYPNFSDFLKKVGVSVNTLKSAELKASFNFFEKPTENAIEKHKELVDETFVWFKKLVEKERQLSENELEKVSTGKLFTGRMALRLGLLDQIGGEQEAVEYLTKENLELENLPILDWIKTTDDKSFWKFFDLTQEISNLKSVFLANQGPRLYSILF
jgi:protease-4